MSDVEPDAGGSGTEPEPYEPTGARRSTFTPPPAGAEPPAFDDDALADALAAQVASYTSPIPIVGAPVPLTPSAPDPGPAPEASVEPEPPAFAPDPQPVATPESPAPTWGQDAPAPTWGQDAPAPTWGTGSVPTPPAVDLPAAASADSPVEAPAEPSSESLDTSSSPTLEAIERLENELRRRAEEARGVTTGPTPVVPSPAEPEGFAPAEPVAPSPAVAPSPVEAPAPAVAASPASPAEPPADEHTPPPGERVFPAPPTFLHPAPPTGEIPAEWAPPAPDTVVDAPGFAPEPPAGFAPEPPAGFAPEPPAGFAPEPPAGFAPEPPASDAPAAEPPALESFIEPEPPAFEPPAPSRFAPEFAAESAPDSAPAPEPEIEPEPAAGAAEPPPLVEPPAPGAAFPAFAPHPEPVFGAPPASPPVDLPPPGTPDFAHLPPPVGIEPAALPPYDPATEAGPAAAPPPHPDDLGADVLAVPPTAPPPLAPPTPIDAPAPVSAPIDLPPPAGVPVEPDLGEPAVDDAVDDIDRVFGAGPIAVDSTGAVSIVAPPSQPIPTVQVTEGEVGLLDEEPRQHPALAVEAAGTEPTALDLRAGRAARMFWLWFAANSSVIALALGAVLYGLGMNLRQSIVAIVIGVALSFLPLGLVTLAGKWSGQPTMIVSRASFGVVGNVVPTIVAVVSRVFWGAALLWLLGTGIAQVLSDAGLDAGLGTSTWTYVALGAGFVLAFLVALFGYGLVARVQLVLTVLTAILVVGVVVLTLPFVDLERALQSDDGPWSLLLSGIVLVFTFVGLAWVHSSADVARYQRPESDGGSTMLWTFAATIPALVLVSWGAILAASDPIIADGLASNPLYTIAALLPAWYPAPLIAAVGLGLLSGVVLTIYSGGFALQALGLGARRSITTVIAGVLVLGLGLGLVVLAADARDLLIDAATTIAVPVAAWAGIFGAEMIIRSRFSAAFHAESLLRRGGVYPSVRWVNLVGMLAIAAIGFGLTSAALPGLDWQGYLFPFLGLPAGDPLLSSDVGVLVALGLGLLLPFATGIPAIRRQERALVD